MNRKSFLKKLGAGALIAAVAPKAIAWKEPKVIAGADPYVPGRSVSAIITNMKPSKTPLDTILEEYEKGMMANQRLTAFLESEPLVGNVVRDMKNGATFREALGNYATAAD